MARGKKHQEEHLSDASGNNQTSRSTSGSTAHESPVVTGWASAQTRCKGFGFYHQSLSRLQNSQSALNIPPPWPVPDTQAYAPGLCSEHECRSGEQGPQRHIIESSTSDQYHNSHLRKNQNFIGFPCTYLGGSQVALVVKTLLARRHKRHGFDPWVRKILGGRAWQPTPAFLPGGSNGQRRMGYSPQGHRESDSTEAT